jgi:hypothetical protein
LYEEPVVYGPLGRPDHARMGNDSSGTRTAAGATPPSHKTAGQVPSPTGYTGGPTPTGESSYSPTGYTGSGPANNNRPFQSPINLDEVEASLSSPHYHPTAAATIVCRKCGVRFPIDHADEHGAQCLHHA